MPSCPKPREALISARAAFGVTIRQGAGAHDRRQKRVAASLADRAFLIMLSP